MGVPGPLLASNGIHSDKIPIHIKSRDLKALLFATQRDHYRKPQAVKMWKRTDHRVPNPNSDIYHTTPALQVREHCGRGGRKIRRARRQGNLL